MATTMPRERCVSFLIYAENKQNGLMLATNLGGSCRPSDAPEKARQLAVGMKTYVQLWSSGMLWPAGRGQIIASAKPD